MKNTGKVVSEIEEFLLNILADYEGEDLKEVVELIRQTVEDFLNSELTEHEVE